MRRGELWTCSGGTGYAGKPRPVLIVQDDAYDALDSLTICGLTSDDTDGGVLRPVLAPAPGNGLRKPCRIMVDKVMTVPRARFGQRIGEVGAADLRAVERGLMVLLGLAG